MAYKRTGGFGLFQFMMVAAVALSRNSGMYFFYGFIYLTLA